MGFKEVQSLDADVVVSVGKRDRKTGKEGPKQVEGYYLGNRSVENKRGESKLHFLQTPKGNLGVWGTTDLNRKLGQVTLGTMVVITSTGTKPTPNGDMYTYKVEFDDSNTIEVAAQAEDNTTTESYDDSDSTTEYVATTTGVLGDDEDAQAEAELAALEAQAARKAKVEALLKGKSKSK